MQVRVLFMGTPDFALPVLAALAEDVRVHVVGVVTQPDRPVGRKRELAASPVKRAAQAYGIAVMQPERIRNPETLAVLSNLQPDVMVTAAYGQLLPQRLLDIPKYGCLNIHASLLPRWRGAAPIQRALLAEDERTGVTVMKTVKALDAGPVLGVHEVPITNVDDAGTLHDTLAQSGAQLLMKVLFPYVRGEIQPQPQGQEGVTYADKIERVDEFVDWSKTRQKVDRQIRALRPWPGSVALLSTTQLKVWRVDYSSIIGPSIPLVQGLFVEPGQIWAIQGERPWVRCGDGWMQLVTVQPEGRKAMDAADWWRGLRNQPTRFERWVP
ncbi:methionyl-tRNA formyltransferase [Alicyclobacillaceae bacterium I2511]|nr:methionyl-tRNA formyltransferase [Alicyclobacillaceae bacterium I2511]